MLGAYKIKHVQHARQIMNSCMKDGLTIEECIGFVDRFIDAPSAMNPCPECKKEGQIVDMLLTPPAPRDNRDEMDELNADLIIYTCSKCRYSEVR